MKVDLKKVRNLFFSLVKKHNETAERSNQRGFNGNAINNKEQVSLTVNTFCKEINRKKVGKDGLLKITRSFIGNDIDRSERTVDKYLDKLQDLGFIKKIEVGMYSFSGKSIQCLYITLNLDFFLIAIDELQKFVDRLILGKLPLNLVALPKGHFSKKRE